MQVILIEDVNNLGGKHELVEVRPGYARNYLIPRKLAIEANSSSLKMLQEKEKVKAKKEAAMLAAINEVITKLGESPLKVGAKTGMTEKIFGSVTAVQISRAIREQKGYEIDRRRISILDDVKELGTYKANVDFGNGHSAEVEFEVVPE